MNLSLHLPPDASKAYVEKAIDGFVSSLGFTATERDYTKPWGGYLRVAESDADIFLKVFFPDISVRPSGMLTPKFLFVAPHARLSWQYHHRRSELWKVLVGPVQAMQSSADAMPPAQIYPNGTLIQHGPGIRHRLIGDVTWGVVTEIWQHTDASDPSNEADIVRIQDDYSR